MESSDVAEQLAQYTAELRKIEELIAGQQPQQHLQVLLQKIRMKGSQFATALQQLALRQHSPAALAHMSLFFKESFTQAVKEAHRLVQIQARPEGQERLRSKVGLIREMEEEMGSVWQARGRRSEGVTKRLDENVSMLAEQLDQSQLKSIAKTYLHKEFLAIRMIAYKLYEQYVGHSHAAFRQEAADIRQAHTDLQLQL